MVLEGVCESYILNVIFREGFFVCCVVSWGFSKVCMNGYVWGLWLIFIWLLEYFFGDL